MKILLYFYKIVTKSFLEETQPLASKIGTNRSSNYQADQHHYFLSSCFCLIFQSFLGVIGSSGSVLHSTLHVSINPVDHLSLVLNQNRNIHEHFMQLFNWLFQLDKHLVSGKRWISSFCNYIFILPLFNIIQSLSQLVHIAFDLNVTC